MKIIKQGFSFVNKPDYWNAVFNINCAGRLCYKSENPQSFDEREKFIHNLIKRGHHSVIEHVNISVQIITDRGVTHEMVRHRLASYSQESTRYCNYSKDKFGNEIMIILPIEFYDIHETYQNTEEKLSQSQEFIRQYNYWLRAMEDAEKYYLQMIENKASPQLARSVLPNSLKTEIVMTCNIREWRHFFSLRADKPAHPQMRALAQNMLRAFHKEYPVFFEDIYARLILND